MSHLDYARYDIKSAPLNVRSSGVETTIINLCMKHYYVYILQCIDGLTYTGITNNLVRRLNEHQKGHNTSCFTFTRRPVSLIFDQEFRDVEQAISFEKKIKKWGRNKKLALAKSDVELLKLLSECKNNSHFKNFEN